MQEMITYRREESIAYLSICRPSALNALSREVIDQLERAFEMAAADPELKVLVLYSEKNFAAGADIKEMASCTPVQASEFSFSPVYDKLALLPIPTIAAIEGYALGGGMELALCCDIRLAAENAQMGFPEIGLGIMPGAGGTVRLPRLIGTAAAAELIFTGWTVDGSKAAEIGLVNKACPPDQLLEQAEKMARRIARHSRAALVVAKQSLLQGSDLADHREAIAREAELWSQMFSTYDQKEGMAAFLEKRKPVYQNS